MIPKLEELSGRTDGLARGEALRRMVGFTKKDVGEIKRIKKEAFAVMTERE